MPKVAITDYTFPDFSRYADELAGCDAEIVVPADSSLDAFLAIARDADAVIHEHLFLTADMIAQFARCRVISHHGKGVDNIAVDSATARGILIANVLDAAVHELPEHLFGLLLCVMRKLPAYDRAVRAGRWHVAVGEPTHRVHGKTLGLVGFGGSARHTAAKAPALGLTVIAWARRPPADAERLGVTFVDLPTLFATADIVSVHLPLTEETRGFVGRDLIGRMKPTAVLLNISRGAIVDEDALVEALREHRLFGAGLDVLAVEPPPRDHPLLAFDNVVLTPHCAWYTEEGRDDVERRTAREVARVLKGGWPASLVNPEAKPIYLNRWKGGPP